MLLQPLCYSHIPVIPLSSSMVCMLIFSSCFFLSAVFWRFEFNFGTLTLPPMKCPFVFLVHFIAMVALVSEKALDETKIMPNGLVDCSSRDDPSMASLAVKTGFIIVCFLLLSSSRCCVFRFLSCKKKFVPWMHFS